MIEVEDMRYYDRLQYASKMESTPRFERTDSFVRGFVIGVGDEVCMNDLGRVLESCRQELPAWKIELAPKRDAIYQWRNEEGELCIVKCVDIDLPFIFDNKPCCKYEQNNLLKRPVKEITLFVKEDVSYKEMEKIMVLSRAFAEAGMPTLDWVYLDPSK